MITKKEFEPGKQYYYSDFYDKSYSIIKALEITKTLKGHPAGIFYFEAETIDNSNIDNKVFHAIGSIHSYSNSFIYNSIDDLRAGSENYKKVQIALVEKLYRGK